MFLFVLKFLILNDSIELRENFEIFSVMSDNEAWSLRPWFLNMGKALLYKPLTCTTSLVFD